MGIEIDDLVVVFPYDQDKACLKCYSSKAITNLAILANTSDNHKVGVHVVPMHYKDDIGIKAKTSDLEDAGLCCARGSYIAMAWIDESSPYQASAATYESHLLKYDQISRRSEKCVASCQAPSFPNDPSNGIHRVINPIVGYPQENGINIHMEDISRDNINPGGLPTDAELIDMFDLLLAEFRATEPISMLNPHYVILTVDNSGSMHTSDIEPAYTNLKAHITTECPDSNIVETEYSNEEWLKLWFEQIKGII